MSNENIERRSFLSRTVRSIAAAGLFAPIARLTEASQSDSPTEGSRKTKLKLEHRVLGKTDLKLTTVGYGAMRTRDEAVIHRALDLGINYLDTARSYMGGQNEVTVGNVLKKRRKEVHVATKFAPGSVREILDSVDTSLKCLQTDYVDVIQAHGLSHVEAIQAPDTLEALRRLKKEGKARFIGFTTHTNQTQLLKAAVPLGVYDMILVTYNFKSSPDLTAAIEEAAKAGIGIVAMKTQAGGYSEAQMGGMSPHQASLKWVLQNKGVASTIPSMVNYDQLNENVQAMGSKMGFLDRKTLHRYGEAIRTVYCRMCGECGGQCPFGVDVQEINRALMYLEGYGDAELAFQAFREIPAVAKPPVCRRCSECSVRCAHGLDLFAKMKKASSVFV
ncbi:MAG TPA: aldo/keto reductase [bacterium]